MPATLGLRHRDGSLETRRTDDPVTFARRMFVAGSRLLWFDVDGRYFPVHPEESQERAIKRLEGQIAQGVLIDVDRSVCVGVLGGHFR